MKMCSCGNIKEKSEIRYCNNCALSVFEKWWVTVDKKNFNNHKEAKQKALIGFKNYLGVNI